MSKEPKTGLDRASELASECVTDVTDLSEIADMLLENADSQSRVEMMARMAQATVETLHRKIREIESLPFGKA